MPTNTARLAIPVPLSSDPANVPSDMLNLANALDNGGTNPNFSGAAVYVTNPGPLGNLPAAPIIGTFYCVSGTPPYLLYYSGENTTPTGTTPQGWRLVGQVGTNSSQISNTTPGNSTVVGVQPVWAPLDHRHASLPWSSNQTMAAYANFAASDGTANAYARADHSHGPTAPGGLLLAQTQWSPVASGIALNTTQLTAIDSTNLTLTLTVPSNGKVKFHANIFTQVDTNGTALSYANLAMVLHGTTTVLTGSEKRVRHVASLSGNVIAIADPANYEVIVSGLTPGTIQVDLAGFNGNAAAICQVLADSGSLYGPALLEAYSAI